MSETHFFEQQDGSRIAYKILEPHKSEDKDNEVPLVMIMGMWSTKENFMGLDKELSKNRKDDPISHDLMAQDTIALIKHLGIKRFNLAGLSMGGMIALCIAINLPSDLNLEKLIICASTSRSIEVPSLEGLYNLSEPKFPTNIQEQKDDIMKNTEKMFADYLLEHPDELDKLAENKLNTNRPFKIFKRQWEAIRQFNAVSKLQTIKVPTLIIHGEADALIPIQEAELLAREIPNNKFIRIPKVGHMFWPVEPKSAVFINDFLLE